MVCSSNPQHHRFPRAAAFGAAGGGGKGARAIILCKKSVRINCVAHRMLVKNVRVKQQKVIARQSIIPKLTHIILEQNQRSLLFKKYST